MTENLFTKKQILIAGDGREMTYVAHGPANAWGGAGDWRVLPDTDSRYVAPGGVVLCKRGTTELHPHAHCYAQWAWLLHNAKYRQCSQLNGTQLPRHIRRDCSLPYGSREGHD